MRLIEMAAKVKDMESELADVHTQLARKNSDRAQWLEAEWSDRCRQLEVDIAQQAARASKSNGALGLAMSKLTAMTDDRDSALRRAVDAEALLEASRAECVRWQGEAASTLRKLTSREKMVERRDLKVATIPQLQAELQQATSTISQLQATVSELEAQVAELEKKLSCTQSRLAVADTKLEDRLSTIRKFVGLQGGRPILNRDDEALLECNATTASHCEKRMMERVMDAVGEVGVEGCVSSESLMDALVLCGWMPTIWDARATWEYRMAWADELKNDLALVWDANLTLRIKDKLLLSYDKVDDLRYKFSHHRVSNKLVPRTWFVNPWDGERVYFPQPVASRHAWTPLIKAAETRYGLMISCGGKVASRSFNHTLQLAHQRDSARGLLRPISEAEPFICVLGADATGVGKVGLTHVAISCAPTYRPGIAQQNEMNINTIAASRTDDHWEGLNQVLGGGYFTGACEELPATSIAAEVNVIICAACTETLWRASVYLQPFAAASTW